jgi:hypothetical protein
MPSATVARAAASSRARRLQHSNAPPPGVARAVSSTPARRRQQSRTASPKLQRAAASRRLVSRRLAGRAPIPVSTVSNNFGSYTAELLESFHVVLRFTPPPKTWFREDNDGPIKDALTLFITLSILKYLLSLNFTSILIIHLIKKIKVIKN